MKHWRIILWIFIGLTFIGIFLPLIVTQLSFGFDVGRSDANEIGDTIGGILGPYFSFIGSCLLAYTIYLQIEQRREDKRKDFEKVIFENCLEHLNKIDSRINELSHIAEDNRLLVSKLIGEFFKNENLEQSMEISSLINSMCTAIRIFNENRIQYKAFNSLFISRVDNILLNTKSSNIGRWNDNIEREKHNNYFGNFFFEYPYKEKYILIWSLFQEILKLKTFYKNTIDSDFQPNQIAQLAETCNWVESIEADFLEYWDLIFGEQEIAIPVGELEDKINIIRAKYNLPAKTYGELLGI